MVIDDQIENSAVAVRPQVELARAMFMQLSLTGGAESPRDETPRATCCALPKYLHRVKQLNLIVAQLRELASEDEHDEHGRLRPTGYAFEMTYDVLCRAAALFMVDAKGKRELLFPYGSVASDTDGGIRIEWTQGDNAVRLIVAHDKNSKGYIYHEFNDKPGIEPMVTGDGLAHWLKQLH